MPSAEQCRRYAAACLEIAQSITDPKAKAAMLDMAERWRRFAERLAATKGESKAD